MDLADMATSITAVIWHIQIVDCFGLYRQFLLECDNYWELDEFLPIGPGLQLSIFVHNFHILSILSQLLKET